ncbi:unnamed protein product [Meloidogyne enterolobii]|uniref:Uncharacterized protein n=1 Tax=Meloidogyne enterolobii TaxID=390850 RepID=A0ACB0ZJD3_MELEN
MSQSPAVSGSTIAARVGRRRRKEKDAKYHEFRSFPTFRAFSDWWEKDEGRNWKVNSRQPHPRGSVEYWRCKARLFFQIDGCYVCPARLRIIIGFDDSVVLYRGSNFSHQHERKIIKDVDIINQAIPMDPFAEKIGRSFFVDAPQIAPENENDFQMQLVLMNIEEIMVPVRELTGTDEGNVLNTPQMVVRTPTQPAEEEDDDDEIEFFGSDELLPREVRATGFRVTASQSSVQTAQVQPTQTQQEVQQQQTPKQTTEVVVKEVQKPKEGEEQKPKEVKEAIEVKEAVKEEVKKSGTTTSTEVKTPKDVKTAKTKLTPPKFSGATSGFAVARLHTASQTETRRTVNDDPRTQSDEDISTPNVKKTANLVSSTTKNGVTSGSANARPTTPPISEEERTNTNSNNEGNSGSNTRTGNASGNSTNSNVSVGSNNNSNA